MSYVFGIPQSISTGGAVGNLPMVRVVGADQIDPAANQLTTTKKDFNLAVGLLSSALEHAEYGTPTFHDVSPDVLTDLQTDVETTKTVLESNDDIQISQLTRDQVLGDIFYAGTLGYYAQYASLSYLAGLQQHAYHHLAAGVGSFGYEPNVSYVFGIPQSISTGGAVGNLPMVRVVGADSLDPASNQLTTTKKDFNLAVGLLSSALEHAVPEQLVDEDRL